MHVGVGENISFYLLRVLTYTLKHHRYIDTSGLDRPTGEKLRRNQFKYRVYSGVDKVPKSKIRRNIFMGDYVEHKRYGIYYHAAMFMKCEDDDEERRRAVVLCTIRYVEDGTVLFPPLRFVPREDPIQKGENVEIVRYEDNLWGTVTKVDETGLRSDAE